MVKNNTLLRLKEQVEKQKLDFFIKEKFSYRFDSRSRKLILTYTIPKQVKDKTGNPVIRRIHKEKYISQVNEKNWKKWFKKTSSIVKDHSKFVRDENELAEKTFTDNIDEYDFRWWIDRWLDRKVGNTIRNKELSHHTIKQNKNHINQYWEWVINYSRNSIEIRNHIDSAPDWFERFYQEKLSSGSWNPTTSATSFRNIRGFYNWIADRNKDFPYDILKRLKVKKSENKRSVLNKTEYEKVIKFIIEKKDDEVWGKFVLMLRLQLKTGMRVGELVSIKTKNIDRDEKCIWISGKTGRRQLNFKKPTDELIWNDVLNKITPESKYLFYQTRVQFYPRQRLTIEVDLDINKNTTESYYLGKFRKMRILLGLRGKGFITSHSLRRYFITRFVNETGNRDLTRQIVGHTSTRMIDEYVDNMIDDGTTTTIDIGV